MAKESFVPKSFLRFDGKDDYVALPPMNIDWSQGLTIEAWVRFDGFLQYSRIVDFSNGPASDNIVLCSGPSNQHLIAQIFTAQGKPFLQKEGLLDAGVWMHLAVSMDKSGAGTLYKNGKVVLTGSLLLPGHVNRTLNWIGRSAWKEDGYFCGQLAELRIWKLPRSEAEILGGLVNPLTGNESGLVVYLPCDDGAGDLVHDRGPNGLHGTRCGASFGTTPPTIQIGPTGSTEPAAAFSVLPLSGTPQLRLAAITAYHCWSIQALCASYEDSCGSYNAQTPGQVNPSHASTFAIPPGDYLVAIHGGYGAQAPGYPSNEIITLQFETKKGLTSPVYGGQSKQPQTTPFTLRAQEGHQIIGFFGTRGSAIPNQMNVLSLGAHVMRVPVSVEDRLSSVEKQLAELTEAVKHHAACEQTVAALAQKLADHEKAEAVAMQSLNEQIRNCSAPALPPPRAGTSSDEQPAAKTQPKSEIGHLEWKVSAPSEGTWNLPIPLLLPASAIGALYVNGVKQDSVKFREEAGRSVCGPCLLHQGDNTVRIDLAESARLLLDGAQAEQPGESKRQRRNILWR